MTPTSKAASGAGPAQPAIGHPWLARSWSTASGAVVAEAAAGVDPVIVFRELSRLPRAVFLDSAVVDRDDREADDDAPSSLRLGRWSFVAADPIHAWQIDRATDWSETVRQVAVAFAAIRGLLRDLACPTIPGLPPFQGGVAGVLGYECGLARLGLEPPPARMAEPVVALGVYDVVFAFDHDLGRGWFISQGVPARGPVARAVRATERLATVLAGGHATAAGGTVTAPRDGDLHPLPDHPGVLSTHTRDRYLEMVRQGIEFVRAGDIFQVNLAQRLEAAVDVDPVALYLAARQVNPAPFAGYCDAGSVRVASMSPERFLQVTRGTVRTHPIKGTRRVISLPEADLFAGDDLEASAKDRAENVMIVDLLRNDLAKVCTPESVRVEALCRLERYRYVQHLVSIVAGRLRPGLGAWDALEAAIPGGSISGAPKHRACEIISALEGVARGLYCGSLGFVGFDGTADFNLLIRTFVAAAGRVSFSAGGGITAASDPEAEYAESLHKAEGMLRALDAAGLKAGATR